MIKRITTGFLGIILAAMAVAPALAEIIIIPHDDCEYWELIEINGQRYYVCAED